MKKNTLINLENIVTNLNNSINDLLHNDPLLFNYKSIGKITNICNIFNELKIIYKQHLKRIRNDITYIKSLEKMLRGEKLNSNNNKKNIFKDLFLEVESTISFFIINFKPCKELLMQFDYDYHYLKMLFLYLFSIFDTVSCLLFYHYYGDYCEDDNIEYDKLVRNVRFDKTKTYLSIKGNSKNRILQEEIDKIVVSNAFKYIKNIRNYLYHRFDNPMLRYHFSSDIMICFIILVELIEVINKNVCKGNEFN